MCQLELTQLEGREIRDSDSVAETRELRWGGLLPWTACRWSWRPPAESDDFPGLNLFGVSLPDTRA